MSKTDNMADADAFSFMYGLGGFFSVGERNSISYGYAFTDSKSNHNSEDDTANEANAIGHGFTLGHDFIVNSLNNIKGISCLTPNGAFYVFPSCKELLNKKTKLKTDTEFVQRLLEKSMVAVVQGSAFGLEGYFRISYATSMKNLKTAMQRIKFFCENLS